jgi:hypothetical protein
MGTMVRLPCSTGFPSSRLLIRLPTAGASSAFSAVVCLPAAGMAAAAAKTTIHLRTIFFLLLRGFEALRAGSSLVPNIGKARGFCVRNG